VSTSSRSDNGRATHAGGVVYRLNRQTPEVLLVTARRDPSVWVLPKGHIEKGESAEQAAVREVFEEAGVNARIVEFLATSQQTVRGERQTIEYFLMERVAEGTPTERRVLAWLREDAAMRRITFAESKAVLIRGWAWLAEHGEASR
jgi:ADP-ribose pyrophosphatase YjhB (NUDIX family)